MNFVILITPIRLPVLYKLSQFVLLDPFMPQELFRIITITKTGIILIIKLLYLIFIDSKPIKYFNNKLYLHSIHPYKFTCLLQNQHSFSDSEKN